MDKLFINLVELKEFANSDEVKPIEVNLKSYCNDTTYTNNKSDKIEAAKYVRDLFKYENGNAINKYGLYYFNNMAFKDSFDVEIFAKAIFKFLFERKSQTKPLYIAVEFEDKDYAKEFIRIFSIFYLKSDRSNVTSYMEKVQIAVCSANQETQLKEVNFVLAGNTLASAYATAKNFVYYNADASLEFVPLLKFLSDKEPKNSVREIEPLFPFDLYLQHDNKSWFVKQMQDRLDTDLRTEKYGCKISDIKVRLGSKIYIDTFYEAELLFHNVGTIKRFAYLIAAEIVKDIEKAENDNKDDNSVANLLKTGGYLFLLGYENYSAVLMQEVLSLLTKYFEDRGKKDVVKVEWLIDTRSEDFPVLSFDKFSSNEKQKIVEDKNNIKCITILPLGSTMSTVYKLHDSFKRGLDRVKKEFDDSENNTRDLGLFLGNYCLVAIGDVFCEKKDNGTAKKYLTVGDPDAPTWRMANLEPSRKEEPSFIEPSVKYLLSASAEWSEPGSEKDDKPLLKVDKTSTLLDAYFQTPLNEDVLKYYGQESNVDMFSPDGGNGYIKYGHILRGDNHYQFYFDFEKITEKRKDDLVSWARREKSKIDNEAYNIVISPLQITNASFLKIILNETFGSNLHLLHINIQATGKENVRTKFEYIAQEFVNITRQGQKINFYYVDDAVCTGNGLVRAWKFLLTLCNQSGVDEQKLFHGNKKFNKVFLLLNRSSYETAQTWVQDPNQDWLGFINLCVPSYNTHMENNVVTCPGCRVHARYNKLRERCATNELVGYFAKHAKKHLPRNPKEYDLWLDEQIMNSPSHFEWLRTWVWYHSKNKDGENTELYKAILNFLSKLSKKEREKSTIEDLLRNQSASREEILTTIKKIVSHDSFVRLKTMDDAYRELLYNEDMQKSYNECREKSNFEDYQVALRNKMISLLGGCLDEKNNPNSYDAVFKFISYIKVISRDYLAKNYFIREAMYKTLQGLFQYMIIDDIREFYKTIREFQNNNDNLCEIYKNIFRLDKTLQYRIIKIVTHRLALMKSEKVFQKDTIEKTYTVYVKMAGDEKKIHDGEKKIFLALPSEDEMITSYLASIKTATMEDDNDAVCLTLWNETKKLGEPKTRKN